MLALMLAGCVSTQAPQAPGKGASASVVGAQPVREDALTLVAQGQLRIEAGEIAEGLKLLRQAYELDPGSAELGEELGLALMEAGVADDALKTLHALPTRSAAGEAALGILLAQAATTREETAAAVEHLERGVDAGQAGPHARMLLVQALIRLERGQDALVHVQRLLEDRPNDPRLRLLAGQALRLTGKPTEAAAEFKLALDSPETRTRATLELIDALSASGQLKEAAELMGQFLREGGATLGAMTRWAALLARSGDKPRAVEVLDEVLSKDPNFREGLLLKALFEIGDNRLESAEQLYRRAIALDPKDPDTKMGLARLLLDLRRLDEARGLFQEVWDLVSGASEAPREALSDLARDRAALELLARRPEDARVWLDRIDEPALGRRSLALWSEYFRSRKAWAEGLTWLGAAKIEDDPDLRRQRKSVQAEFLLAMDDPGSAEAAIGTLKNGDEEDVLAALAVYQRRKLYDRVIPIAMAALERFPESREIRFDLASALERAGQWDRAVEEFRKLLAGEPEDAAVLNYLGYMFADRNQNLDEARTMLLKAVEQDPTSGAFLDSLGWVYFRLGDLDLAEKYLVQAVGLEAFDATLHEHLGDLWTARKQPARAAEAYRRALGLELEEAGQKERLERKQAESEAAAR
ncbi:MAG: tetratricopeptide repeat protein [Thermoanaerobaculaceae bacterium]|jgi:tetratricopeptide (TPR) repeat protein|nr:tetratricopeptide repeat protein [Thermoanaerobaculaceae bacterium]